MSGLVELLAGVGVVAAVAFVLLRTPLGARLQRRVRAGVQAASESANAEASGTTTNEDYAFLLERCKGDEAEVLRRLEVETRRNPNLDEAQLYRRAIRSWFVEKRGGTHGSIAEELDDTWL